MLDRISLDAVLRPFRNLSHLSAFAVPQNTYFNNEPDAEMILWPPNLKHVTLSGSFSPPLDFWVQLVRGWPPSLQNVVLTNYWWDLDGVVGNCDVIASLLDSLDSVHVSVRSDLDQNLVETFSDVKFLSLPLPDNNTTAGDNWCCIHPVLERLEIRPKNQHQMHLFCLSELMDRVKTISTLRQIRVHSSLVEDDNSALDAIDALLRGRAQPTKQEGKNCLKPEEAGIVVFKG